MPARKFTKQICRDADDDAVLACALAAKADVIVTGDKDLIVLHPWNGIQILSPADALQWLTSSA
ncbi:MAG: putative toxin-antitoxin system toxin component, PIN family [Candidatus Competibacter sp.]|nr:putative toxin-antitoxin system toxin component, PIN family [Candidatus Competibacter sp.]